jgi:chromosome segregation and condensation protein ScpB
MADENFEIISGKVEAVLFSYADWIAPSEIMPIIKVDSESLVLNSLRELQSKFAAGFSFEVVSRDDGKWKMQLRKQYDDLAASIVVGTEIPKEVLKVLSVIAYEQPVTKTKLAEILGKSSVKNELLYLKENKFISSEKDGIGTYYRLTKKFYDYFAVDENADFRSQANQSLTTFMKDHTEIVKEAKALEQAPISQPKPVSPLDSKEQGVSSEK